MVKKIFLSVMLLATVTVARAFDFSHQAPSGQILYYNVTSVSTVAVVAPAGDEWGSFATPAGLLVIPATVEHGGTTYSVTTIGQSAFEECTELTHVVVPEGVLVIEGFAFYGCSSLDTIELPSTLTDIFSQAFTYTAYASNSANRDDQGLLLVDRYIVSGSARAEIIVPEGVLGIAGMAFYYNHTLEHLTLPASLHFISGQAFADCIALDTIRCLGSVPPQAAPNTFLQSPSFIVAVPCNTGETYSAAPVWGDYTIVEDCTGPVEAIADEALATVMVTATAYGIVVSGVAGHRLVLRDVLGRIVTMVVCAGVEEYLALPATGFYLLSVDGGKPLKICYSK